MMSLSDIERSSSSVATPRSFATSRTRARSMPPPSSLISMITRSACRAARIRICAVGGLPRAARSPGLSMPWSSALRTMCSNGSNSISTMALSASVSSPSISGVTGLPRFSDISRTTRGNLCNTARSGSTRIPRTDSCNSARSRSRTICRSFRTPARAFPSSCASLVTCPAAFLAIVSSPVRRTRASTRRASILRV